MLTLQALMNNEGNDRTGGPIWNYATGKGRVKEILERVLNQIVLSNSTLGNFSPMQVIKQPEHGTTSTTEEND